jgi:topoisomerase-4 subunit B
MTQSSYNADAIEVLTGLEPVAAVRECTLIPHVQTILVRKLLITVWMRLWRSRAKRVEVILHADQSLEVIDDGRGMPVDIHPEEGFRQLN